MATFRYKARDKAGTATVASLEGESRDAVARQLRGQGLQIITLEEAQGAALDLEQLLQRVRRAPRPQEVVLFTRQLALMVRSGLPLIEGIEGLAGQAFSPAFKQTLAALSGDLQGGKSFSEALARAPACFPTFYVSMVKAGETAGMLDEVLERLASIGESEMELKGRVRAALAYPVLLVFLSFGIVTFLLVFILPRFIGIFEESGVALPLPTRILLGVSFLLRKFWFLLPLGLGVGGFWLARFRRSPEGRLWIHRAILRTPYFGPLILKTILARAFRILSSLLRSGIPAVPALAVAEELMGNQVLAQAVARVREQVIGGKSLAEPFRAEKVFPGTIAQLVTVGERTGALDTVFLHLADYYEGEVDRALRAMTSVLEPVLLLSMGLFVGFIALSVLLPIFQLIRVFQR